MRILRLLLGVLILSSSAHAQTLLFGGTNGNGDFENGTSGWTMVNGNQTNKWVVGNNATSGFGGTNCIYISSSSSAPYSHSYNTNAAAESYFYKDVAIPAGTKKGYIVFDYIVNGDWKKQPFGTQVDDGLMINVVNTNTTITAGSSLPGVTLLTGLYYNQPIWRKREVLYLDVASYAGTTMRLVFQWSNNGSGGNQPPAAIDNIEMYVTCQEMVAPSVTDISAYTARFGWSTIPGATGYELRYRKANEPTSVASFTNPITIPGGNSYYTDLSGFSPSTDYVVEMRPIITGSTCTDFSGFKSFTTLTPPANDVCTGAVMINVENDACEGTPGTFYGAMPSIDIASTCSYNINDDVWYKFVATNTKQIIQTVSPNSFHHASGISLFTGACNGLQAVNLPCAVQSFSPSNNAMVSRLVADGLTIGTTYYVRVGTSSNNASGGFRICVYNPPSTPACPTQLSPANNLTNVSGGVPVEFKWTAVPNAAAYRLHIIQQSGAYTEIYTKETSYSYTLSAGINYTWNVMPYNVQDVLSTCTGSSFATCPSVANNITLTANSTTKCSTDSIKITASAGNNLQWFLNNVPIAGATDNFIWAKAAGNYTVRFLNGACYSDPSNTIAITNLATPVKPTLTVQGPITFCEGGSVVLSVPSNVGNQWFIGTSSIAGANGQSYTATQPGNYFVRYTNTSSGCSNYSDTILLTVTPKPTTPVITTSGALSFCAGGSVSLQSSTANGNQWYRNGVAINGATIDQYSATQSGIYTVVATQNNCSSNTSIGTDVTVLSIPAKPTIAITGNTSFCSGDSVKLQSSASTGNQWFRNDVAILTATGAIYYPKEAAVYTVKVFNNCLSEASTGVTTAINPLPTQPIITVADNVLSTATGYSSYQWYLNNAIIASATNSQYTVSQVGAYKVEVSGANGCKIASAVHNFVATAVSEVVWQDQKVKVYPNPVPDNLTIEVTASTSIRRLVTARFMDISGKVIFTQELKQGKNKVRLNSLPAGIYYVSLNNGSSEKVLQVVKTN